MIRIRGAREHNLKNIDVDLPRNKLIVISGLSGSGKSSLAFDTLYAEGQRRYVESLSAYARQFLDRLGKPAVDSIEGLSPAISIDQKTTSRNPRSTVGTVTEIQDYLRLLFARVGTPHCPNDGSPIEPMSLDQILERLFEQAEDQRARILAPLVVNRKGTHKKLLDTLRKDGFLRAVIDGEEAFLEQVAPLEKTVPHTIKLVVDRVVLRSADRARIAESVETALRQGEGQVEIDLVDEDRIEIFSEKNACLQCGEGFPDLSPQLFSFNSPAGACLECDGLGTSVRFDPALVVRHPEKSLLDGAIPALTGASADSYGAGLVRNVVEHFKVAPTTAWERLPEQVQQAVLYGTSDAVTFKLENKKKTRSYTYKRRFEGAIPQLERRLRETGSQRIREDLDKYMRVSECPSCAGDRLNTFARNVKVCGSTIGELMHMELADLLERLATFRFEPRAWQIAEKLMQEVQDRTGFLVHVGLDYLALSRAAHTLSGGEAQRIRLATQIGSKLVGVLYVLDEPSIGLHQSDQARLIETLRALRDLGNTVIVVEHDEDTIRAADHVVDLGPGAGVRGGYLIAQGTPAEVEANQDSVTGQYLASPELLREEQAKLLQVPAETLTLRGCTHHNLQTVDLHIPLQRFVAVTGVSGSGKSSLIMDTLYPVLSNRLHSARLPEGQHKDIEGVESIQKVLEIDQNPIGRTPRSNPATYSGVFTDIRELFAQTQEARARGYSAGRFSFNVKGGRCESCQGDGCTRIEMHFLPDVFVECDVCRGTRYNSETLDIHYKGRTIVEVLNMDVDEALAFFENVPSIRRKLDTLHRVGLGYIKLGQPATTLSGGEAQRLKLSRELVRKHSDHTLYILDEPTTGLHFDDVRRLVHVLTALVESGNTVVVIEHNLDLISAADWVVDLGPAGGHKGGQILAEAPPAELAKIKSSRTGAYLQEYFERKRLRAAKVD